MTAPDIDWERIEADFRAGILSLREIAAANPGVSHMTVKRRATKEGWSQDLSAKIAAKAEELVTRRAVTGAVTAERTVTDKQIVEVNAAAIASVRLGHRKDIVRFRNVALDLLAELESETGNAELFQDLGNFLRQEDDKGQDKRNDVYQKVISSVGRIDGVKKLAEVLKILIGLEREAYGIADTAAKDTGTEKLAEALEAARKRRRDAVA